MTDLQRLFGYGVMLNSALYLGACFIAGLWTGNTLAWRGAIVAMGLTYVSYTVQFAGLRPLLSIMTVVLSIMVGTVAGLAFLF